MCGSHLQSKVMVTPSPRYFTVIVNAIIYGHGGCSQSILILVTVIPVGLYRFIFNKLI